MAVLTQTWSHPVQSCVTQEVHQQRHLGGGKGVGVTLVPQIGWEEKAALEFGQHYTLKRPYILPWS